MANSVTTQLILDGQRNAVIKIEGILDTSDIVAGGTIGTGGFTTTAGSNIIAFTAGALVPIYGQSVTFSDVNATFAPNTYITSVIDATHVAVNRNAKISNAAAAVTITGVAGTIVVADPQLLTGIDNTGSIKAGHFRKIGRVSCRERVYSSV